MGSIILLQSCVPKIGRELINRGEVLATARYIPPDTFYAEQTKYISIVVKGSSDANRRNDPKGPL
jgi:hypothetical protein